MICPFCGKNAAHTERKQDCKDGHITRTRLCYECGRRFTTYEKVTEKYILLAKEAKKQEQLEKAADLREERKAKMQKEIRKVKEEEKAFIKNGSTMCCNCAFWGGSGETSIGKCSRWRALCAGWNVCKSFKRRDEND